MLWRNHVTAMRTWLALGDPDLPSVEPEPHDVKVYVGAAHDTAPLRWLADHLDDPLSVQQGFDDRPYSEGGPRYWLAFDEAADALAYVLRWGSSDLTSLRSIRWFGGPDG